MNNLNNNHHEELLNQLGDSLVAMTKNIKMQHGNNLTCLTPALDKTLMIIGSQSDTNVKHISDLLSITPGAATQHITLLEKEGAITRVINKVDRREIIVRLTDHGRKLFKQIRNNQIKLLEEMFSGLNDDELKTLVDLTMKASKKHLEGVTKL